MNQLMKAQEHLLYCQKILAIHRAKKAMFPSDINYVIEIYENNFLAALNWVHDETIKWSEDNNMIFVKKDDILIFSDGMEMKVIPKEEGSKFAKLHDPQRRYK